MEFTARNDPTLGPNVRRYSIVCAHGASSALLLPGRRPLADLAVFDFLMAGHYRRQRCRCAPALPAIATEARA